MRVFIIRCFILLGLLFPALASAANSSPTGGIYIYGKPLVGQTLSVSTDIVDPDGIGAISFNWQISTDGYGWGSVATGNSFPVAGNYVGNKIRAVVSYTDQLGNLESVSSSGTEPVGRDFSGTSGNVTGTLGADRFSGGVGNNYFDGGPNRTTDTVTYTGSKSNYAISYGNGIYQVTGLNLVNANNGTDTLKSIEQLVFSDGVINLKYPLWSVNETGYSSMRVDPKVIDLDAGNIIVGWADTNNRVWLQRMSSSGDSLGSQIRTDHVATSISMARLADGSFILASDGGRG